MDILFFVVSDIVYKPEGTKGYAIEAPKYDTNGLPISDGTPPRIIDVRDFAKACDGILDINAKGEVVFKVCFAAGTLVHTQNGLVPIEKIKIGNRVLSQPEQRGQIAYRPVVNTVVHEDKEVYLVQFHAQDKPELGRVVASGNHPSWVQGKGWMAVEYLQPGQVLELQDGSNALVHSVGKVRHTQVPDIGWAADDRNDVGVILDLSGGTVKLASEEITRKVLALDLGEAFKTRVFNFEVEEFHTYYVETLGVWVHNTNCNGAEAVRFGLEKPELQGVCFGAETLVLDGNGGFTEIQYLQVGDMVLSRSELTGEIAPKRILKIYERSALQYKVAYISGPKHEERFGDPHNSYTSVTGEHPFWVQGKGWTAVRDLQPGDILLTYNDDPTTVEHVLTPEEDQSPAGYTVPWPAPVYNLEVEDFNTYFVDTTGVWVHNCNNVKPDINMLNTNRVTAPAPEWSPFHLSTERLQNALAGNEVILKNDGKPMSASDLTVKIREIEADKVLVGADIKITALPAKGEQTEI